jgi:hypothetical protein
MAFSSDRIHVARIARPSALVGVPAGLAAGIAYLLAQVLASLAMGGVGSEPFQRISAILLGPDALPPPSEWSALLTAINHMLFGLVAALLCITLRRYFASRGRL